MYQNYDGWNVREALDKLQLTSTWQNCELSDEFNISSAGPPPYCIYRPENIDCGTKTNGLYQTVHRVTQGETKPGWTIEKGQIRIFRCPLRSTSGILAYKDYLKVVIQDLGMQNQKM